jgi:hypothetical protein
LDDQGLENMDLRLSVTVHSSYGNYEMDFLRDYAKISLEDYSSVNDELKSTHKLKSVINALEKIFFTLAFFLIFLSFIMLGSSIIKTKDRLIHIMKIFGYHN